jgi:hypothetical protein
MIKKFLQFKLINEGAKLPEKMISDIKDIFYILEDEGCKCEIVDDQLEITLLNEKKISNKTTTRQFKRVYHEFLERCESICLDYGQELESCFGPDTGANKYNGDLGRDIDFDHIVYRYKNQNKKAHVYDINDIQWMDKIIFIFTFSKIRK